MRSPIIAGQLSSSGSGIRFRHLDRAVTRSLSSLGCNVMITNSQSPETIHPNRVGWSSPRYYRRIPRGAEPGASGGPNEPKDRGRAFHAQRQKLRLDRFAIVSYTSTAFFRKYSTFAQ
jgi:hypothetical protein